MKVLLACFGLVAVLIVSPGLAYLTQPWSPWWITSATQTQVLPPAAGGGNLPQPPTFGPQPIVSDLERFLLALGAGWSFEEAITATAISIAEDGGGDPAILSPRNSNGTFDLGLWQINSSHWDECGGAQALSIPTNNAHCGHGIYVRQGWCAWSTYDARCGRGHTGAYAQYLPRADAAAGNLGRSSTPPPFGG